MAVRTESGAEASAAWVNEAIAASNPAAAVQRQRTFLI
jgi:hypothetical protein